MEIAILQTEAAQREGLELALAGQGLDIVVADAVTEEALSAIASHRPAAVLVDLAATPRGLADLCRRLAATSPGSAVLAYSASYDPALARLALAAGASGYLLKQRALPELQAALATVGQGRRYIDPKLDSALSDDDLGSVRMLSAREREILRLLADGLTGEGIAKQLYLSPETVRTHVRNAVKKLRARTRTHAVVLAIRLGEIQLDR
jgi:DNA-binding NarL/FixJ family response regulator